VAKCEAFINTLKSKYKFVHKSQNVRQYWCGVGLRHANSYTNADRRCDPS